MAHRRVTLDERQRKAVDSRRNAVVTAGAGSGKTRVLSERYLRLVLDEQVPVDRILTLTFTRKAAAEMHERIFRGLSDYRHVPFVAEQLGRFETARISTVDSFCGQIARNGCTRFGVPTSFRVDEDEIHRLSEDAALAFLLDNRHNPVLARFIALNGFDAVRSNGFAMLARDYVLVSREQNPAAWLSAQMRELGNLYRRRLAELDAVSGTLMSLEPSSRAIAAAQEALAGVSLEPGWDPAQTDRPPEGLDGLTAAASLISKRTGAGKPDAVETYKSCVDEIRRLTGEITKLVDTFLVRDDLAELYRLVGAFEEQVRAEKRRRGLLSYRDVMELAVDLLKSDPSLREYYIRRFRYIMIDEFQDNNDLQKELLYLLSLRSGASPERDGTVGAAQLDPQKLFFVGDEKQSIYRFRGADVSVFKRLSEELAAAGGDALELPFNYRSAPELISFFNSVFARAMGGASADYEARFAPLHPPQGARAEDHAEPAAPGDHAEPAAPASHLSAAGGHARVRIAWKPPADEAGTAGTAAADAAAADAAEELLDRDQAEAYYVAKSIRDAVEAGLWTARGPDGERKAGYDDVAILMRSTSNQRHYERMLRLFGVPYSTQSVRSLFESAPVYDVYNVLQLCVHPEDRAAYASVLRSPLVSVSDDAIARLLLGDEAPFAEPAGEELREEDAAKYRLGAVLYSHVRDRLDEEPVSRIVADLWYRFGYRYRLLATPALHPYLEYYDHLYELARTMDDRPAVEFVDAVRENLGVYGRQRDLEVVRDEQRGVQLLTIHKSKGLEFPVVVLANTGNMGRSTGIGTQPFYVSTRFGLTAAMAPASAPLAGGRRVNYFFDEGERENREMELAELKRLLYVALTRAESHLLVTGVFNSQNRKQERHLLNQLLNALGIIPEKPEIGATQSSVPVDIDLIPDVPRSRTFAAPGSRRSVAPQVLRERYRRAPRIERVAVADAVSVSELAERFHAAIAEEAAGPVKKAAGVELPALESDRLIDEKGLAGFFGTLTHYLIQDALTGGDAGKVRVPSLAELPPALRREALRREVTADEYRRMGDDAAALADRFLSSPPAATIAGCRLETEVPFVLHRSIGSRPAWIRGQIDLVAIGAPPSEAADGNGDAAAGRALTVIDFKTDRIYRPRAHELQLALYREAAAELYGSGRDGDERGGELGGIEVAAIVCYLRSGTLEEAGPMPELSEELLTATRYQASNTT
ncbi:MAG: UvrD-helicase domain-containing protein [Spirochaetaceae bacterium]